jgi:hypothetical protein
MEGLYKMKNFSRRIIEKIVREELRGYLGEAIDENLEEDCWDGYERVEGSVEGAPGSCKKKTDEAHLPSKRGFKKAQKAAMMYSPAEEEAYLAGARGESDEQYRGDEKLLDAFYAGRRDPYSKRNRDSGDPRKARYSRHLEEDKIEDIEYNYISPSDATYDDGNPIDFILEFWDDVVVEAEYQGRKVTLNKPMQGDVKKFKVYVKDPKTKNVKKVNFGDPNMRIKKSNPKRRKAFRDRHNCKEKMKKGDKTTAGYWSCKKW